ncbi:MAG: malto-oligosyltrehalose synthase [Terracidiphilus sp.]|jgi:(1->4)-alpha-D-glucan 1-alpha-D-glucosylmutase
MIPRPITSTYRVQLHAGFTFGDAANLAAYLKELGISHLYCSPYLQAAKGSMHGYDAVDPQKVSPEIGGEQGHAEFCDTLRALDIGQLLDIVPNHMATGPENRYWWDVLENGPSSLYATWFDVDWNSAEVKLQNKILIPVLGEHYGRALSSGQIVLHYESECFQIRYLDHQFPLAPRSLSIPLALAARSINAPMLDFVADSLARLPSPDPTDLGLLAARHRDKAILYDLLKRLATEKLEAAAAIHRAVDEINKNADALDALLSLQNYRLAYWRTADQELGYRRFFDVNTLIGVRVERPHVFQATHCRIIEWLRDGVIDGVRVDHPDGLRDPEQYFDRLRASAPGAWILAEKILEPGESLRPTWPIAGTTGYDFLNLCNGLLVNSDGLSELTSIHNDFIGQNESFQSLVHAKKLAVEREALGSDVNRLAQLFVQICENNRDRRDYTRAEIRRAIREVAACFSVYRSYVAPDRNQITDEDRSKIGDALALAKTQRTDIDPGLYDFIGSVLTLETRGALETEFLLRFQEFTSPVMAKGVEDTAFYCFNRMIGLNEVGGAPNSNGVTIDQFHGDCARMQAQHPLTMTTLSTHDTKRADDVRARLAVLTEIPSRFRSVVQRWSRKNRAFKTQDFPDANTEYFLYQTLIGAWPISKDRVIAYMEKAVREAKQQTSWTHQNQEFEDALKSFIERILESADFLSELESFVAQILLPGRINSLTQTLLKCIAPGVPDTYQGSELWDLRLVDPDNRGPVDYEIRRSMLAELKAGSPVEEIMKRIESGLPKMWLIHQALHLRRERPQWFDERSSYAPLPTDGAKSLHVIAFLRADSVAAIGPRWNVKLGGGFGSATVELPNGRWKNLLTDEAVSGGRVRVQTLLQRFPVGLLRKEPES